MASDAVLKLLDYAHHCRTNGMRPIVYGPELTHRAVTDLRIDHLVELLDDASFKDIESVAVGPDDLAIFACALHHDLVLGQAAPEVVPRQLVQLISHTRHADPEWHGGRPRELLDHLHTRILIGPDVEREIRPLLDRRSLAVTVTSGHASASFEHPGRSPRGDEPLRVAYSTAASELGQQVEAIIGDSEEFHFRALDERSSSATCCDVLHWAEAFLATPDRSSALAPGVLQAMAAGAVVVAPDPPGLLPYCRAGETSLGVASADPWGYVTALNELDDLHPDEIERLRTRALDEARRNNLAREATQIAAILDTVALLGPRSSLLAG